MACSSGEGLPDKHFHILEMNEYFEEIDGDFECVGTLIVYEAEDGLHHAISNSRNFSRSNINPNLLKNDIRIPKSAYSPRFLSSFTLAPEPLQPHSYIKRPGLISYDRIYKGPQPDLIARSVLIETQVCEALKKHPHPNIATYLGCQVSEGRIIGLCFTKYDRTLMQEANPNSLAKRQSRRRRQSKKNYSQVLTDIASGIQHLHSLGWVHNDINPMNIMFDGERAVIIDFGSCRKAGQYLDDVGRTYEWYDDSTQISMFDNDLKALEEIRIWLGDDSKEFQFDE